MNKAFLFGGLVIAFGPIMIGIIGLLLGSLLGCTNAGGDAGTCVIGGSLMGEVVWGMAMMHWLSLMTFLPGMAMVLIGIVLSVISKLRRKGPPSK